MQRLLPVAVRPQGHAPGHLLTFDSANLATAIDWVLSFDIGLPSDRIDMKLPLENLMANGRSTSELDLRRIGRGRAGVSQRRFLWKRLRPGAHHG
jgi:hypothetical protein